MSGVYLGVLAAYVVQALVMHRQRGPEAEGETHLHRGLPAPLMPLTLFFVYQVLSTPAAAALVLSPAVIAGGGLMIALVFLHQLRRTRPDAAHTDSWARALYVSGGLMQTVLLVLACYVAYRGGVLGRELLNPKWVILGLIGGHLIFGVSLVFSHRTLDSVWDIVRYTLDPRPPLHYAAGAPRQIFACLDVSIIEELVYRVAAQGLLLELTGRPWVALVVTAVVFSVVHRHFFYNHIVDSIEFLAFSLLLGVLYFWTGSLTLVVLIHTVRNLEIVYFDARGGDDGSEHPELAVQRGGTYPRGLAVHAP